MEQKDFKIPNEEKDICISQNLEKGIYDYI